MTQYKRQIKWTCRWMLGVAMAVRLLAWGLGDSLPDAQQVMTALFFLETGTFRDFQPVEVLEFAPLVIETKPQPQAEPVEAPPVDVILEAEPEETPEHPIYTQAQADDMEIGGTGQYTGEILPLLNQDLGLDFSGDAPTVLILHSHTCEAYAQTAGWEYEESDTARTQDSANNMVRVGEVLAETLEAGGLSVIHDQTVHDYPDYNSSYANALVTMEYWLEKYPSITMVIDVHRDGAVDGNGLPMAYTTQIDGEDIAKMMLVVGTDQGGLYYPDWVENFAFALQLQAVFLENYDDYARPVNLRTERFNQHATLANILVEIGSHGNTLDEAMASAVILGQGILELTACYQGS
ncbi:MAG: stage II sporulation protein P [Eubacteriales bacterium]